ncbi:MAG: ABC transporter permease [Bacillota bacterium]
MATTPFARAQQDPNAIQEIVRPSVTYWADAWRRLKQSRTAMFGLCFLAFLIVVALLGPALTPWTYSDQDLTRANLPPNRTNWFGTDDLGRDLLTRTLYGARISLLIGLLASFIQSSIGIIYGGISGFAGGRTDNFMMRIVDILYGIPVILFVIILMMIFGAGLINIVIAIGALYWLGMARIVRGQILALKEQEFVLAARTIGAGPWRILFRHLLPNCMGPIIVTLTLSIPGAIFTEAFLSFIGLGVSAPMASWGTMAADSYGALRTYPWQLLFPAGAISLTMLAFNFLGDGLRDALDPRMRK